jgi:MFS family permease
MLWFVCFLNNGDRQAISAILPKLQDEFGFSAAQLGLIGSAFMWVYAANSPIAGYLGDRLRRKDLILGGCFFWSVIAAVTGLCSKVWQFVVVRGLEGFGETFYFPASMSLISDYHGKATRSKAMSWQHRGQLGHRHHGGAIRVAQRVLHVRRGGRAALAGAVSFHHRADARTVRGTAD